MWILDRILNKRRDCSVCKEEYWYGDKYPQGKENYCSEICYKNSVEYKNFSKKSEELQRIADEKRIRKIFNLEEYKDTGILENLTGLKYQGKGSGGFSTPFKEFINGILYYPCDFKLSLNIGYIKTPHYRVSTGIYEDTIEVSNNGEGWFALKGDEMFDGISFSKVYPEKDDLGGFFKKKGTINTYVSASSEGGFWDNYKYTLLKSVKVEDIRNPVFVERLLESEFYGAELIIKHLPSTDVTRIKLGKSHSFHVEGADWLCQDEADYLLSDVLVDYVETARYPLVLKEMACEYINYIQEDICIDFFMKEVSLEAFNQNRSLSPDIVKLVGDKLKSIITENRRKEEEESGRAKEAEALKKALHRESKIKIYSQYRDLNK